MAEKLFYSKAEAAEILGVCNKTIERYLLAGKLKGAKPGRDWKISAEDINAFYEASKKETAKMIKARNTQRERSESGNDS